MDTIAPASQPPAPVTFAQAFRYWLKLGFISFGGPTGHKLVDLYREIERKALRHTSAATRSLLKLLAE